MQQGVKQFFIMSMFLMNTCISLRSVTLIETFIMVKRVLQNPTEVGGVAPLSNAVCQEIVSKIPVADNPLYILEVGAGCGTTTEHIIKKMKPCDQLILIEIDPEMCQFLKNRYKNYQNITVHCCSILDWQSDQKYDFIISTLPFNSFDVSFVQQTVDVLKRVAKFGCVISYVECPIVRQLFKYFFSNKKREIFENIQSYLDVLRLSYEAQSNMVWWNFPPIEVHHLQF